jgi:hypothetical protein
MPDDAKPTAPLIQYDWARLGFWGRGKRVLRFVDNRFHFFVSLPVITLIGLPAAETIYADVAAKFAKAITLQQYLYFDYRDAIRE